AADEQGHRRDHGGKGGHGRGHHASQLGELLHAGDIEVGRVGGLEPVPIAHELVDRGLSSRQRFLVPHGGEYQVHFFLADQFALERRKRDEYLIVLVGPGGAAALGGGHANDAEDCPVDAD